MLMDLFYDTLPPHLHAHRRRVHFHAFMLDVFRRVHAIKHGLSDPSTDQGSSTHTQRKQKAHDPMEGRSDNRVVGVERLKGGGLFAGLMGTDGKSSGRGQVMDEEDAIYEAARELAVEGRILCFDEVSADHVSSPPPPSPNPSPSSFGMVAWDTAFGYGNRLTTALDYLASHPVFLVSSDGYCDSYDLASTLGTNDGLRCRLYHDLQVSSFSHYSDLFEIPKCQKKEN